MALSLRSQKPRERTHLRLFDHENLAHLAILCLAFALDIIPQLEVPIPLRLLLGIEGVLEQDVARRRQRNVGAEPVTQE